MLDTLYTNLRAAPITITNTTNVYVIIVHFAHQCSLVYKFLYIKYTRYVYIYIYVYLYTYKLYIYLVKLSRCTLLDYILISGQWERDIVGHYGIILIPIGYCAWWAKVSFFSWLTRKENIQLLYYVTFKKKRCQFVLRVIFLDV